MVKKIIARMKKNVISMHLISLQAPMEPRNEMIATTNPVPMRMEAEATYDLVPSNLSMNDLSDKVHTPIEKTVKPPN